MTSTKSHTVVDLTDTSRPPLIWLLGQAKSGVIRFETRVREVLAMAELDFGWAWANLGPSSCQFKPFEVSRRELTPVIVNRFSKLRKTEAALSLEDWSISRNISAWQASGRPPIDLFSYVTTKLTCWKHIHRFVSWVAARDWCGVGSYVHLADGQAYTAAGGRAAMVGLGASDASISGSIPAQIFETNPYRTKARLSLLPTVDGGCIRLGEGDRGFLWRNPKLAPPPIETIFGPIKREADHCGYTTFWDCSGLMELSKLGKFRDKGAILDTATIPFSRRCDLPWHAAYHLRIPISHLTEAISRTRAKVLCILATAPDRPVQIFEPGNASWVYLLTPEGGQNDN